ncbi:Hypothetical protein D9617_16g014940 [Elsinoe fawcettii]|nr:Hypothetical protein D9617_16g014940 [Elsinoe fawcettii]
MRHPEIQDRAPIARALSAIIRTKTTKHELAEVLRQIRSIREEAKHADRIQEAKWKMRLRQPVPEFEIRLRVKVEDLMIGKTFGDTMYPGKRGEGAEPHVARIAPTEWQRNCLQALTRGQPNVVDYMTAVVLFAYDGMKGNSNMDVRDVVEKAYDEMLVNESRERVLAGQLGGKMDTGSISDEDKF